MNFKIGDLFKYNRKYYLCGLPPKSGYISDYLFRNKDKSYGIILKQTEDGQIYKVYLNGYIGILYEKAMDKI